MDRAVQAHVHAALCDRIKATPTAAVMDCAVASTATALLLNDVRSAVESAVAGRRLFLFEHDQMWTCAAENGHLPLCLYLYSAIPDVYVDAPPHAEMASLEHMCAAVLNTPYVAVARWAWSMLGQKGRINRSFASRALSNFAATMNAGMMDFFRREIVPQVWPDNLDHYFILCGGILRNQIFARKWRVAQHICDITCMADNVLCDALAVGIDRWHRMDQVQYCYFLCPNGFMARLAADVVVLAFRRCRYRNSGDNRQIMEWICLDLGAVSISAVLPELHDGVRHTTPDRRDEMFRWLTETCGLTLADVETYAATMGWEWSDVQESWVQIDAEVRAYNVIFPLHSICELSRWMRQRRPQAGDKGAPQPPRQKIPYRFENGV